MVSGRNLRSVTMAKYNFEDKDFGETVRIEDINKKVAQIENGSVEKARDVLEEDDLKRGVQSVLPQRDEVSNQKEEEKEWADDLSDGVTSRIPDLSDHLNSERDLLEHKRKKKCCKNRKKVIYVCSLTSLILIICSVFLLSDRQKINQINQQQAYANMPQSQTTIKFEALIRTISNNHSMLIYDITNDRRLTLELDQNTVYQDINGKDNSFLDFSQGDIIHVEMKSTENKAVNLKKIEDQWEKTSLTNVTVDINNFALNVGKETYSFSEETLFIYNGKFVDPATILPVDTISISGIGSQVWKVYINTYHGYLDLKNSDKVKNGKINIDSVKEFVAEQKGKIPISVGIHKIIVSGDNIEDFPMEIYIAPSETYELDLNDLQPRNGVLSIATNVDKYLLQIDGHTVSSPDGPQVLEFGTYQVTILADGYEPWQQEVSLYQSALEINAQLVPYVKMGTLNVSVDPEKAQVFIDEKFVGISPISVKLKYGDYKLRIEKDGYLSAETIVTVSDESQNTLIVIAEVPEKSEPLSLTPSASEDEMQTKNGRKPRKES